MTNNKKGYEGYVYGRISQYHVVESLGDSYISLYIQCHESHAPSVSPANTCSYEMCRISRFSYEKMCNFAKKSQPHNECLSHSIAHRTVKREEIGGPGGVAYKENSQQQRRK